MAHTIEIVFNVSGVCTQIIQLAEDCELDGEQIADGLNGNRDESLCTTVQEGGDLIQIFPDGNMKVLGTVVSSDVDAEYDEFDCKGD